MNFYPYYNIICLDVGMNCLFLKNYYFSFHLQYTHICSYFKTIAMYGSFLFADAIQMLHVYRLVHFLYCFTIFFCLLAIKKYSFFDTLEVSRKLIIMQLTWNVFVDRNV